jgi:hypothetical protein
MLEASGSTANIKFYPYHSNNPPEESAAVQTKPSPYGRWSRIPPRVGFAKLTFTYTFLSILENFSGTLFHSSRIIGITDYWEGIFIVEALTRKWWFWVLVAVLVLVLVRLVPDKEPTQAAVAPVAEKKTEVSTAAPVDVVWKNGIVEVANSQKSETEKFDEVTKLARAYKPDDATLKSFESFIVAEFKSGAYLKNTKNHEYMLSNVFKSTAIERHYDDKLKQPIDTFALDFLQNTKYTYRGESATSDSVKSNESQMKKTLEKIK